MKTLFGLLSAIVATVGFIVEKPMPKLMCDCFSNSKYNASMDRLDSIHYKCLQYYLMNTYNERWYVNVSTSGKNYVQSLEREMLGEIRKRKRRKRQAGQPLYHGYRKEIRTLDSRERSQFFAAVNALKNDRSVFPNQYQAIADFHAGATLAAAHGGPAFMPWHRYYLYLFENALRRKDRRVTLCYWDSSKDSLLPDPINSNIWGPEFLGNADGAVVTGPFAGWYFLYDGNYVPLTRNAASSVDLFPTWGVQNIYTRIRNREIFEPTADSEHNIETFHNWVHSWIGGTMLDSQISPNDPVFFLHHAFVDCVWERFRIRQAGIIGQQFEWDYPSTNNILHNPYTPFGGQLRELNNINGLLSIFGDVIYKYDKPLECPRCEQYGTFTCRTGQCVPTRRPDIRFNTGNGRRKRSAELIKNYDTFQHNTILDETYQNSFLLDGAADVSRWAFIPIRMMYKRPDGSNFNCKPVHAGKFEWDQDIYAVNKNSKIDQYLKHGNFSGSKSKYDSGSGATKLFVQSDGMSYSGKYVDYGIVDTRHVISETIAYVGVKNPRDGTSVAYISAYDLHGLVCRPRCLDPSSKTIHYKECSGVIQLTTGEPKMYGDVISDAVLYRYSFTDDRTVPNNRYQEIFLTFVCEYSNEYPWENCQI